MAEPKKALETPPARTVITITFSSGSWAPAPTSSSVQPNGTVQFNCSQACWIWTEVNNVLTNAFVNQQNDYLSCQPGSNSFTPSVSDGTTITIIPLAVNSNPPSAQITENVRGTVKVSSTGVEGKHEK